MVSGYLDCFSGVSGNMLLGSLLAAGVPKRLFTEVITALGLQGTQLIIQKTTRQQLSAIHVHVQTPPHSPFRHLDAIQTCLMQAPLSPIVQEKSLAVFQRLAKAEAKVHGCDLNAVHFHEVGAVDALVDIVGTVAGLDYLGIQQLHCSPLPMPQGWVSCQHGEIPLPAPAVCELLQGLPVQGETIAMELVTPTGAALVAELADEFGMMPPMKLQQTAYGAGTKARPDGRPNLLRLLIGTPLQSEEAQTVEIIETHLDDWDGETWPYVAGQLLAQGALDVSLTPLQLKKGRPGFLLKVICDPAHGLALKETLFNETGTGGLRFRREVRMTLTRTFVTVETPYGPVKAKCLQTPAGQRLTPEYEDCCRLAQAKKIPIRAIYDSISPHQHTPIQT